MNIYLHVEISQRELDSKLLLGIIAASKGYDVMIADISEINRGLTRNLLEPGIFHTKSLTPSKEKINFHSKLKKKGFIITSHDEEGFLELIDYKEPVKTRFSEKTINQAAGIFAWGKEDYKSLKSNYQKQQSKIFKTGSSRVDLWRSDFKNYWDKPISMPKKPFILFSSNMHFSNNRYSFYELYRFQKNAGYYKRDKKLLKDHFIKASDNFQMMYAYIEAIKYISKQNIACNIVFRPHPVENINVWRDYFKDLPNVRVIRDGPINLWIQNCIGLIHNSCTSSFEAMISNKPIISFIPFNQQIKSLTNSLGFKVQTLGQLKKMINKIIDISRLNKKVRPNRQSCVIINKKIYTDDNELASKKIVKLWIKFTKKKTFKKNNWKKFKLILKILNSKDEIKKNLNKYLPYLFKFKLKENWKFEPVDSEEINKKVSRLCKILNIKKLNCIILSKRAILIKGASKIK